MEEIRRKMKAKKSINKLPDIKQKGYKDLSNYDLIRPNSQIKPHSDGFIEHSFSV